MLFHSCSDIQVDCKEEAKLQRICFDDPMMTLAIIAIEGTVHSSVTTFSVFHAETQFFVEKNIYTRTRTHTRAHTCVRAHTHTHTHTHTFKRIYLFTATECKVSQFHLGRLNHLRSC